MELLTSIEGCVLRPWRVEDRPSLVKHADNRRVWRNLTDLFPSPYTLADADAWIELANARSSNLHLAVVLNGEAIGGIGVIPGSGIHCYTGKFGYWLGELHWGKGIATSAARTMVDHVLSETELVRLEAPVFAWNPASGRVLVKVGFVLEGIRRREVFKDGEFTDTLMYALVREKVTE